MNSGIQSMTSEQENKEKEDLTKAFKLNDDIDLLPDLATDLT
mgnify:CR=1 FL=1